MESWSYVPEGKGFEFDESVSAPDFVTGRGKNGFFGWELKTPYSCEDEDDEEDEEEAIESQGFVELGFPETARKSFPLNQSVTKNAFPGQEEEDSSSRFSSSVVESTSWDSSLIDLKLGRFSDQHFGPAKAAPPTLSSAESSTPAKRGRGGWISQTPFCLVHGCKKDLSSCKDYNKRHKVCEVHSKTAKVTVNGIEQRFCQQCSRFHLLAEFDDGKRSCRKRLAGHNERRRKPHVGIHSGRTGRLFQPYIGSAGSRFQGNTLTTSSFICQDILPCNVLHPQKYDMNDWSWCKELEDGANYCPQSAIHMMAGHPKLMFGHGFEKYGPPFHGSGVNSVTGRDVNENNTRSPHDLWGPNSFSGSLILNSSTGSEDFTLFNSASTIQGLPGTSASGRALSLLSSQSQNYTSYSSEIPMAQPLTISDSHGHFSVSQVSGKILGGSPQASTSEVSQKFNSAGMKTSVEENLFDPILISHEVDAANFTDGIFQGSQYVSSKDRLHCEDGPTIDLLQLSSQLQWVDHRRQSMQVKQKNNAFCGLKIT